MTRMFAAVANQLQTTDTDDTNQSGETGISDTAAAGELVFGRNSRISGREVKPGESPISLRTQQLHQRQGSSQICLRTQSQQLRRQGKSPGEPPISLGRSRKSGRKVANKSSDTDVAAEGKKPAKSPISLWTQFANQPSS